MTRRKIPGIILLIILLWITVFAVDWLTVTSFAHPPIFCVRDTENSHYTGLGYSYDAYTHPVNGEFEYRLVIFGSEAVSTFTN